jgi:hypothetical protein
MSARLARAAVLLATLGAAVAGASPRPWPQRLGQGIRGEWQPTTLAGDPVRDAATAAHGGAADDSAGATPVAEQDLTSGDPDRRHPTACWSIDAVAQVLFVRMRVAEDPLAPGVAAGGLPDPVTNDIGAAPWAGSAWALALDTDGDGHRRLSAFLDGVSGGSARDVTTDNPSTSTTTLPPC